MKTGRFLRFVVYVESVAMVASSTPSVVCTETIGVSTVEGVNAVSGAYRETDFCNDFG